MSTGMESLRGVALLAVTLTCCATDTGRQADPPPLIAPESEGREGQRPEPVSRFQYRLQVAPDSLPEEVVARERQVPGTEQVQTWLRNESEIPFVVASTDRQGTITHRRNIVGGKVYLEARGEWQLLEGVEEVLLELSYTPDAIVKGREASAATDPPPLEHFSIPATFGGEEQPIRGEIVYSLTSGGSE